MPKVTQKQELRLALLAKIDSRITSPAKRSLCRHILETLDKVDWRKFSLCSACGKRIAIERLKAMNCEDLIENRLHFECKEKKGDIRKDITSRESMIAHSFVAP